MSFLTLERLEKIYPGGTRAVKGIDLAVGQGELIVLLGPSGCGKTTTLRMVAGLELATGGAIHLGGREVTHLPPSRRDVGMVFQFYALYPHLAVRDNIAFPLRAANLSAAEIRARVDNVAARMGLEPLLASYPKALSGGDQQKVSLARAIVRRPAIYLMDEPLGTLDADQRLAMRELIRAEQLSAAVTTIYVTHDQEEAMSLADRVVVMEGGLIRQVGTPAEVYDTPADLFVANFVGSPGMNFIPGKVLEPIEERGSNGAGQSLAAFVSERGQVRIAVPPVAHRGQATLGIRCEHIHEDPLGPVGGRVVTDEYMGNARNVHVETDLGRLIMRCAATSGPAWGSQVRLRLDAERISLFDGTRGGRL